MPDFSNFLEIQTKTAWGRTLSEFADFCAPNPGSVILDVGCGPGLLPAIFARDGHLVFGVDIDFSLLASPVSTNLVQADACYLPYSEHSFSLITATNLLFFLPDPTLALQEWSRLLSKDGVLCLLNPSENISMQAVIQLADKHMLDGTARASLLGWAHNAENHNRWTETETQELLSKVGLNMSVSSLHVGLGLARFARGQRY